MQIFGKKQIKKNKPTQNSSKILKKRSSTPHVKKVSREKPVFAKKPNKESRANQGRVLPNMALVYLVILFIIAGLLMVYSASYFYSDRKFDGDVFFIFKRQFIFIIIGLIAAFGTYITPLKVIKKMSVPLIVFGIFLLIIILPEALFKIDLPIVATKNGATRWLTLRGSDFQPAEYIKFTFIIYLSAWLTRQVPKVKKIDEIRNEIIYKNIIPFILLLGSISFLILAQRDLDTTMILVLTIMSVYYASGTSIIHSISTVAILGFSVLFGFVALLTESYRRSRVLSYLKIIKDGRPEDATGDSFQVWNGIVAIGTGKLWGSGYTESHLKLGYMQEAAYTDSIFAVIGEEFGLIGTVALIIAFLYFMSLGFDIAKKAPDRFSSYLALGMTSWITIQALLNIAANLAVIPFGGMPLPFFTYGGSNTIMNLMAVGIILNVSREGNRLAKRGLG